jgi:hypothetical protein
MKHLGINLAEFVKDMDAKKYKGLMKKSKTK